MDKAKPFSISKWAVRTAWEKVRANRGAPGVDDVAIAEFEQDLHNNLYKIWNRMSSGSYFPPPVRLVEIPKAGGRGVRTLGVPTVADRVAQTVVAAELEKIVEPVFDDDSYGYRPRRSALDAVATCRQRCWEFDWVVDCDVKSFFDEIDHQLLLSAVRHHTDSPWVLLYIKRWLQAPAEHVDGTVTQRYRGTPQGSAVSPVLANLFLHYAFDAWMRREFPSVPFERYADDMVVHCRTRRQAQEVRDGIAERMVECGLQLHPDKTKIVYCKDSRRSGSHEHQQFDFLGYTFRPRLARSKYDEFFVSFLPAVSDAAAKRIRHVIKRWRLHLWCDETLNDLAAFVNQIVRGWISYYARFYRTRLIAVLQHINHYLVRWFTRKYKSLKNRRQQARAELKRIAHQQPDLFAHWRLAPP